VLLQRAPELPRLLPPSRPVEKGIVSANELCN
jgi:hypothetical protein